MAYITIVLLKLFDKVPEARVGPVQLFFYRYAVMLSCWRGELTERPAFSQLVEELTQLLMSMSDYMDLTTISTFGTWAGNPSEFPTIADITEEVTLESAETTLPGSELTTDGDDPEAPKTTENELEPELTTGEDDTDDPEAPKPTEVRDDCEAISDPEATEYELEAEIHCNCANASNEPAA